MKLFTTNNISRLFFLTLVISLVWYIILANFSPLGLVENYRSGKGQNDISTLGPANRVKKLIINNVDVSQQTEDLIYFTTKMPFQFDTATISMTYQNEYPDQEIYIGYQDQEGWHYNQQLFDSPILTSLGWMKVGSDPVLLQQSKRYKSIGEFLKNPPRDEIIGLYNIEREELNNSTIQLPSYQPQQNTTVIDKPLRGSHTLYAYVESEHFKMNVQKQDINWYEGEDNVAIRIYKDKDLVYSADIADDGITDGSRRNKPPQEITIQNPGPGLPEKGVYKIVLDASGDSVITKISTNLHKIVVANSIYLAGNKDVYTNVIKKTTPTTLYTQSPTISALTYHKPGVQELTINEEKVSLEDLQKEVHVITDVESSIITIPKNDTIIKAPAGYFAFSKDAYFSPTPYQVTDIKDEEDIDNVDFILTSYNSSTFEDKGWKTTQSTFDLNNAVVKDGKLSWLIRTPKLKENNRKLLIKEIRIKFIKKPLI